MTPNWQASLSNSLTNPLWLKDLFLIHIKWISIFSQKYNRYFFVSRINNFDRQSNHYFFQYVTLILVGKLKQIKVDQLFVHPHRHRSVLILQQLRQWQDKMERKVSVARQRSCRYEWGKRDWKSCQKLNRQHRKISRQRRPKNRWQAFLS